MTAATSLVLLAVATVALVVWDLIQSKRIDALQKRVEALEKK
jgi:hypothetical protein